MLASGNLRGHFADWADRLASFAGSMAITGRVPIVTQFHRTAPADDLQLEACERELGIPLPQDIKLLFQQTGYLLDFHYRCEVGQDRARLVHSGLADTDVLWGGATLNLAALSTLRREMRSKAERLYVSGIGMEEEREFWMESVPLMRVENGDYLAVATSGAEKGDVRYLSHEGPGEVLAHSLAEFLSAWEQVCYVGPEIWLLESFRDSRTGTLAPVPTAATALRAILLGDVS